MAEVALAVVLGAAFLFVFYRAVEFQWPAAYFVVTPGLLSSISQSPYKYAAFRLAPVFFTSVFVAVSIERADENALVTVLLLIGVHVALTTGQGLHRQLVSDRSRNVSLALLHGVLSVALLLTGVIAVVVAPHVDTLVPPLHELSASLWTALLAGVVGAYLVRLSRRETTIEDLLRRSRRSISTPLWERAENAARANGVDVHFVHALMLVENLERPPWARSIERFKGKVKLLSRGSYGIMQVTADHPISDEESVDLAVSGDLSIVTLKDPQTGYYDEERIKEAARRYNPDHSYADAVLNAFYFAQRPDAWS